MDNARYQRYTKDACLIRQVALPAAGAPAAFTDALDLGNAEIGPLARNFDVEIAIDQAFNLIDNHKITCTLQDSDDGVNFAPVPHIAPFVVTGANDQGADASAAQFSVSTSIRRYLRVAAAVDAGGGDNTAMYATLSLVF